MSAAGPPQAAKAPSGAATPAQWVEGGSSIALQAAEGWGPGCRAVG